MKFSTFRLLNVTLLATGFIGATSFHSWAVNPTINESESDIALQGLEEVRESGHESEQVSQSTAILSRLHRANSWAIEVGKLAEKKGSTDKVKEFARKMVQDHQAIEGQIQDLAAKKKIKLVQVNPSAREKKAKQRLMSLEGENFDRSFMTAMGKAYGRASKALTSRQGKIQDQDVASLVKKIIPVLDQEREQAIS